MYVFIVNPQAGSGRGMRIFSKLKKSTLFQTLEKMVYFTEYPGHAKKIAGQINQLHDITTIIVIGGDGTLHEVINGLYHRRIPIGFIPGGSGNDFARGLAIHNKPNKLLKQIVNSNEDLLYWVGSIIINQNEHKRFVNSVGFGFDAQITRMANEASYKSLFNRLGLGKLTYIVALIQVLMKFKPMTIELEINDEKKTLRDCWMLTTCNHPYYGGGMKIIPTAKIQDEVLPLLILHKISKWKVLSLFLTVFTGLHVKYKEVEIIETTGFKIISKDNVCAQIDGQTFQCRMGTLTKRQEFINIRGRKYTQTV
ncbi:diacylglycerol/lipid kinase family protein [Oceanobacillus halophilus]|uniref:Diacylglycerol kinase family lipid kinase n=1 Tax=Oceanobacillus halophilus TaxID=930130 RepID=A0A494ZTX7_9BACI|nr:diacylglycerol kinase family protein [Oceanobacillus halophilus]RKQ29683.1 diacylglycerol kinase family lipid kinase [Oceanobacillus halophilus]